MPTLPSLPGAVKVNTAEDWVIDEAARSETAAGGVVSGGTTPGVTKVLSPDLTVLPKTSTETTW